MPAFKFRKFCHRFQNRQSRSKSRVPCRYPFGSPFGKRLYVYWCIGSPLIGVWPMGPLLTLGPYSPSQEKTASGRPVPLTVLMELQTLGVYGSHYSPNRCFGKANFVPEIDWVPFPEFLLPGFRPNLSQYPPVI